MSLFKRLFGIRKAGKELHNETKIDYEVADIKKGFILDYDLKSWEVKDVSVYTWQNGSTDHEYTITDGTKELFLNLTSSEELSIYWANQIDAVWPTFRAKIRAGLPVSNEKFSYNGKNYLLSSKGNANVKSSKENFTLKNWLFQSTDGENYFSFNQYEDGFIEVYEGKKLKKHAVTNILPRK